jgi:hypothetical protein
VDDSLRQRVVMMLRPAVALDGFDLFAAATTPRRSAEPPTITGLPTSDGSSRSSTEA